jgi:hypothetical protein
MTMHRTILLSAVIGLSLANATGARADLCFRYTKSGGGTLVAKDAKVPEPGTCQPLAPLALFEVGGALGAANGMICRDGPGVGGRLILFHYNYDACLGSGDPEPNSYTESGTCRLQLGSAGSGSLPTQFSFCRLTLSGGKPGSYGVRSHVPQLDDLQITECFGLDPPTGEVAECTSRKGFSGQTLELERSPDTRGPDTRGNR